MDEFHFLARDLPHRLVLAILAYVMGLYNEQHCLDNRDWIDLMTCEYKTNFNVFQLLMKRRFLSSYMLTVVTEAKISKKQKESPKALFIYRLLIKLLSIRDLRVFFYLSSLRRKRKTTKNETTNCCCRSNW